MMKSNNTSVKTAYVIDSSVAIRNGQYGKWEYRKSEAPRFVPMGAAVYLKSISVDADTLERTLNLTFVDAQEKEVHLVLERKNLSEQGVLSLLSSMADSGNKENGKHLGHFVDESRANCSM